MVSLIQISYSLNDNESSLSFDPSNKLKVFKNIVNLTQKINVDLFDIYYNDKIINAMDEMEVKRIIGHDTNPYFLIIKKNASPQERANYKLKLSQVKKKENKFKFKVLIQNYPSRTEMNTLINSFLDINFIHDNFFIDNKQNCIQVMFSVKNYAENLIKFIDREKAVNPLYSKINTILYENDKLLTVTSSSNKFSQNFHEGITVNPLNNSQKSSRRNNTVLNPNNSINHYNAKSLDVSYISRNTGKNTYRSSSNNNNNLQLSNNNALDVSDITKIKEPNVKERVLDNYYKNSVFLRNSSPYLSEEDKMKIEYKENKQKWISKDFVKFSSNKYQYIPNYVNLDEFRDSPLNYQFRQVNKKKWVGSNFYL